MAGAKGVIERRKEQTMRRLKTTKEETMSKKVKITKEEGASEEGQEETTEGERPSCRRNHGRIGTGL